MTSVFKLFEQAAKVFDHHVGQIQDSQWDGLTPDTDWSVRDLVNHVTGEDLWVAELMAGKTVAEVGAKLDGDILGADPKETWSKAFESAAKAFSDPEAGNKSVNLSRGDTPARDYAEEMFADHVIHAWDLAAAVGADRKLPDELVKPCYEFFQKQAEAWRAGGAFAAAVKVPEDASLQDRLLALTGRDPNWSP